MAFSRRLISVPRGVLLLGKYRYANWGISTLFRARTACGGGIFEAGRGGGGKYRKEDDSF
jgi:hypothetical protein